MVLLAPCRHVRKIEAQTVLKKHTQSSLEPQLLEEPLVLACLDRSVVLVLEHLLDLLPAVGARSRVGASDDVSSDNRFKFQVHRIACRHQVVVVNALDEGLHLQESESEG